MAGLRATRKVKQPISYAEPSTKSKLRRGDVLFPKTDADNKKSGVGSGLKTTRSDSPTTDLDRIMEKNYSFNIIITRRSMTISMWNAYLSFKLIWTGVMLC